MQAFQFKDHPLVLEDPSIRFFAAAPLLSSNDIPIAVFSVWSQDPRESFTQAEKAELSIHAHSLLQDLEHLAATLAHVDGRSTPLLQRDSIINGDYEKSMATSSYISTEVKQVGAKPRHPQRFYEEQAPSIRSSSTFSSLQPSQGLLCEQTPPSSAEPGHGPTFSNLQQGFGRNFKQLLVNPELSTYPQLQDMITPEYPDFDISRPFSGSDLTSVHREPNNTPHNTPVGGEVADFLALSDRDVYEDSEYSEDYDISRWTGDTDESQMIDDSDQSSESNSFSASLTFSESPDLTLTARNMAMFSSSPLIDLSTPPRGLEVEQHIRGSSKHFQTPASPQSPLLSYSDRSRRMNKISDSRGSTSPTCTETVTQLQEMVAEQLPGLSLTQSTISSQRSGYLATYTSEVDSILARYSRELGYDKMYAVEMVPARFDITERELYEPGGIKYKVLASYGPAPLDPQTLNHVFHIDCLRSGDFKFYSCHESNLTGIAFPYPKDSIIPETRIRGTVFGAFKNGVWPMDPHVELKKLWKVMDDLMDIIARPSRVPIPRRLNTDPAFPKPFPASEAREIGGQTTEHQSLEHGLDHALDRLHMQDREDEYMHEDKSVREAIWPEDQDAEDRFEHYTLAVNHFGHAYLKKRSDRHSQSGSDVTYNSRQHSQDQNIYLQPRQPSDAREAIARTRQRVPDS